MSETFESTGDDAEWQELREQHNDAVKNLKDGGPPIDHELLEDYVSDALDGVAKAEVVRLILTWKAWHDAENKMQHDIHSSLAEMGLSDPYSPEFDDALRKIFSDKYRKN